MGDTAHNSFAREKVYVDLVAGTRFFGWRRPVDLPITVEDRYFTLQAGQTLAQVSQQAFGTPLLDWLLADLNEIVDPFELEVGTVLRVPTRARVELELERPSSG